MRSVFFNNTHFNTHTQKEKESRERMSFESEFCVSYAQKRGRQKKKAHTKNAFDLGCTTLKQSKRASQKKKKKRKI
jgi:hypothetical protein